VSAELIRREPLLVAMSTSHRLAEQDTRRERHALGRSRLDGAGRRCRDE
jgi:hypothetical protein